MHVVLAVLKVSSGFYVLTEEPELGRLAVFIGQI